MTKLRARYCLLALIAAAFALRVLVFFLRPEAHPDEFFQYVDPAVYKLHGVSWKTWEWRDGIRSWVLPYYHGGWMAVAGWLGVRPGLPTLHFLQLHWALISSVAWVALGWTGARAVALQLQERRTAVKLDGAAAHGESIEGWQPAFCGGLTAAVFPPLLPYGPRTLSEVPSALCLLGALVVTAHVVAGSRRRLPLAAAAGALASFGVCLRIANGPLAIVPVVWLLLRRRWLAAAMMCLGALPPIAFFGAVDWLTWGEPFSSYRGYIRFNFINNGAAAFGTEPSSWYFEKVWERAGAGAVALLAIACLGWRATWPFVMSAVAAVCYLSTQDHKEERFILFVWPALLLPASAVAGHWWRSQGQGTRRLYVRALVAGFVFIMLDGLAGFVRLPWNPIGVRLRQAEGDVADRPDVTGVVMEDNFLFGGGYCAFGQKVPLVPYRRELLNNPIFNYVIVRSSSNADDATRAGFERLATFGDDVTLLRRPNTSAVLPSPPP